MRELHLGALYALGFISGLRAIRTIKEDIQWQSRRLIFLQCTAYRTYDQLKETADVS